MTTDADERLRRLETELDNVRRENALRFSALEDELAALREEQRQATAVDFSQAWRREPDPQAPPPAPTAIPPAPAHVPTPQPPLPEPPLIPESKQPASPARPRSIKSDKPVKEGPPIWERLAGPRGIAVGGGIVLLLGIAFLFAIAAERGWVTPAMRCGIGAGASIGALGAAFLIRRRFGLEDAATIAAGVGFSGLYASLGAASVLFDLVPLVLALAGVLAIATAAVVTAIRWKSELVAAFGLAAALVAGPIATGSLDADAVLLSVAILAAGTTVCLEQRWRKLLVSSIVLVGPQALALGLMRLADESDHADLVWVTLPAAAALLLVTGIVLRLRADGEPVDRQLGLVLALASFPATLFAFAAATDLPDGHGVLYGLVLIPPALVFLVLGAWLTLRKLDPVLQAVLLGAGFGLVAVLSASALGGATLTLVFAVEAAVVGFVTTRARDQRFLVPAVAYLVAGAVHAFTIDVPIDWFNEWHDDLPAHAWVFFPLAGAALVLGVALRRTELSLERFSWLHDLERAAPYFPVALELIAATAAMWGVSLYLLVAGHAWLGGDPEDRLALDKAHVALCAVWIALGVALYLCVRPPLWRWYGQAFLAATAAKLILLDSELRSWRWVVSTGLLAAGAVLTGAVDGLRRPRPTWLMVDEANLGVAAVAGFLFATGLPEHWSPAPSTWQLLAGGAAIWLMLARGLASSGQRDLITIAWSSAGVYAFSGLAIGLVDHHRQILVFAYVAGAATLLAAAMVRREPRAALGGAAYGIAGLLIDVTTVATPDDFLESSSTPATGLASVVALVALGVAFTRLRPFGFRPDGDDLDRALARGDRRLRLASACVAATLALYAGALAILGLAQLLPGEVDTNFQRGHAVVSGIWAVAGLAVLFLSLYRDSRGLRIGALIVLAVSVAKLFAFDLAQLSSLARAFSFIGVGFVLLAAGLAYARLASDLKQQDSTSA